MTKFIELTEINTNNPEDEAYRENNVLINVGKILYIRRYKYKSDGIERDTVYIGLGNDEVVYVKESYEYIIRELDY